MREMLPDIPERMNPAVARVWANRLRPLLLRRCVGVATYAEGYFGSTSGPDVIQRARVTDVRANEVSPDCASIHIVLGDIIIAAFGAVKVVTKAGDDNRSRTIELHIVNRLPGGRLERVTLWVVNLVPKRTWLRWKGLAYPFNAKKVVDGEAYE